jgi:acid stress chaperone HdeB
MNFSRIMKSAIAAIAAAMFAFLLSWSAPATAGQIDLAIWTCKQFQSATKDEVALILAWLDGFYRGEDDPPVIDTDQFAANGKKLNSFCSAHPDTKLITATDTLFERE